MIPRTVTAACPASLVLALLVLSDSAKSQRAVTAACPATPPRCRRSRPKRGICRSDAAPCRLCGRLRICSAHIQSYVPAYKDISAHSRDRAHACRCPRGTPHIIRYHEMRNQMGLRMTWHTHARTHAHLRTSARLHCQSTVNTRARTTPGESASARIWKARSVVTMPTRSDDPSRGTAAAAPPRARASTPRLLGSAG